MARRSPSSQTAFPFPEQPQPARADAAGADPAPREASGPPAGAEEIFRRAIADPHHGSGLLPLAEVAVRASSGDGLVLLLAARGLTGTDHVDGQEPEA